MMSFLHRRAEPAPTEAETGTAGLLDGLDNLYAAPVPDIPFNLSAARSQMKSRRTAPGLRRHWKPLVGLAAAAAVAAVVSLTALPGGGAQQVNAEQIFGRSQGVASGTSAVTASPYHLVATAGNGTKASTIETWFQDASHFRTVQTAGPDSFTAVVDGNDVWLIQDDGGNTTVVHATGQDAVAAATSQLVQGAISSSNPQATSLAGVLAQYSNGNCESVSQQGTRSVAGREAYVIVVTPQPRSCTDPRVREKLAAAQAGGLPPMTVLIDEQTFQTLQAEQRDASGAVMFAYQVTQIEVGQAIPASTFEYQPPAGVTPVDATSAPSIKQAFGSAAQGEPPAQTK